MADYIHVVHPFEPIFDCDSRVLILGSFPSVQSRADGFYYGNSRNRFWKMLAAVFDEPIPKSIEEKKALLKKRKLALYDAVLECDIKGSADTSMRNVVPTDISAIMKTGSVKKIITNGKAAAHWFFKSRHDEWLVLTKCLPSTSPANFSVNFETLVELWKKELLS